METILQKFTQNYFAFGFFASFCNSRTIAARESGDTPRSMRLNKIDNDVRSRPVFNSFEISKTTIGMILFSSYKFLPSSVSFASSTASVDVVTAGVDFGGRADAFTLNFVAIGLLFLEFVVPFLAGNRVRTARKKCCSQRSMRKCFLNTD